MSRIEFSDLQRYALGAAVAATLGAAVDPATQSVSVSGPLVELLSRIGRGEATVLPLRQVGHDEWLIAGATRRDLDAALAAVSRFIAPTYAEHEGAYPSLREFDPGDDNLGRLARAVYPAGYYTLRSPSTHFKTILERLGRWAHLEATRPQLQETRSPSYRDLYDDFSAALAAGAWGAAQGTIDEIRRRGLATAENLVFLEVQLLAQQHRWADLWRRDDYRDIARLRSPRAVQAALLAAFHQSVLLPFEQDGRWPDALDEFRRMRGFLGRLIEGPADTTYAPALLVHAYREVAVGNREAVERLAMLVQDEETRHAIDALVGLLPASVAPQVAPPPQIPTYSSQQVFRLALADGDYAGAMASAETFDMPADRARGQLEVAFLSGEAAHAEVAIRHLHALPETEQQTLLQSGRLARIVEALAEVVAPPVASASTETLPADWLDWLAVASADVDDERLAHSLSVVSAADDRYWTSERACELAERLTELVIGGHAFSRPHMREAVRLLRNYFLRDPEFPRDEESYANLYEALYTATVDQREANELVTTALMRLAEARLRRTPAARVSIAAHLQEWLADPVPVLEAAAQEVLDLLAAYGVQGPSLAPWYRRWAEALLVAPRPPDRITLESWLSFGEWVQPGPDLIDALRSRLGGFGDRDDDPVAALKHGYKIGVFTLSPDRVGRVAELLQRRNPGIEVITCDDKVLTDRARNLVEGADMIVVVTGCVKHALTYGIQPYLKQNSHEPVYPASVGSTSILRAIEARLRQTQMRPA